MRKIIILWMFVIFSFAFINQNLYAVFAENSGSGRGECCSASALLGGSCTATCLSGECCRCEGGLFTARCLCYACADSPVNQRTLPQITQQQRHDALEFSEWCQNQTPGIQSLRPIVLNIINAIDTQNQEAYSILEKLFRDTFVSLSQNEQEACNQWAISKGY